MTSNRWQLVNLKLQDAIKCADVKQKMAFTNITEKEDTEIYSQIDYLVEALEWKDTIGRKHKGGVVKIISKLDAEITPPIEKTEQPFLTEHKVFLGLGKLQKPEVTRLKTE